LVLIFNPMNWIIGVEAKIWVAIRDHIFPSLVLPQFYKISTTNSKSPFAPHQFGIEPIFLLFSSTKIYCKKTRKLLFTRHCSPTIHAALLISPATTHSSPEAISYPFGVRFTFHLKSPGDTEKSSRQLDNRSDFYKLLFDADTVPVAEDQRFRPHFQSDLSLVWAIEILG